MNRLVVCVLCVILRAAQSAGGSDDVAARAMAAREANDVPRAIELYRQALELNPKWEEGWWYLGSMLYDSDQYAAGRDALRHVVELDAKAGPAWALLGLCEFETEEYKPALDHVEHGLAAGAATAQMEGVLRYHEAQLLTRNGEFDRALKAYAWFAQRRVQNPELVVAVGLAALRSALLRKDIPPDHQDLYATAGKAAYASMSGDFATAQADVSELLERFPTAHYVHYLAGCFMLAAKPDTAMAELRRELDVTPNSGAANAMLAWMLLEQGETDEARPYAEAAAVNDTALPLAQYVFGRYLLEQGKVKGSIEHLRLAENSDPANVETHMSLATAYSKAAEPMLAREERIKTLALLKENPARANP
jgi:tetratricopeptide (TPR) repeat protein